MVKDDIVVHMSESGLSAYTSCKKMRGLWACVKRNDIVGVEASLRSGASVYEAFCGVLPMDWALM